MLQHQFCSLLAAGGREDSEGPRPAKRDGGDARVVAVRSDLVRVNTNFPHTLVIPVRQARRQRQILTSAGLERHTLRRLTRRCQTRRLGPRRRLERQPDEPEPRAGVAKVRRLAIVDAKVIAVRAPCHRPVVHELFQQLVCDRWVKRAGEVLAARLGLVDHYHRGGGGAPAFVGVLRLPVRLQRSHRHLTERVGSVRQHALPGALRRRQPYDVGPHSLEGRRRSSPAGAKATTSGRSSLPLAERRVPDDADANPALGRRPACCQRAAAIRRAGSGVPLPDCRRLLHVPPSTLALADAQRPLPPA